MLAGGAGEAGAGERIGSLCAERARILPGRGRGEKGRASGCNSDDDQGTRTVSNGGQWQNRQPSANLGELPAAADEEPVVREEAALAEAAAGESDGRAEGCQAPPTEADEEEAGAFRPRPWAPARCRVCHVSSVRSEGLLWQHHTYAATAKKTEPECSPSLCSAKNAEGGGVGASKKLGSSVSGWAKKLDSCTLPLPLPPTTTTGSASACGAGTATAAVVDVLAGRLVDKARHTALLTCMHGNNNARKQEKAKATWPPPRPRPHPLLRSKPFRPLGGDTKGLLFI